MGRKLVNVGRSITINIGKNIARPAFLNKVENNMPIAVNGINVRRPIRNTNPPIDRISGIYIASTKEIAPIVNDIDVAIITTIIIKKYARILPQRYSQRLIGLLRNQDSDPFLFAFIIPVEANAIEKATPKYNR